MTPMKEYNPTSESQLEISSLNVIMLLFLLLQNTAGSALPGKNRLSTDLSMFHGIQKMLLGWTVGSICDDFPFS